ncbi:MAG: NAD(P)H-dependent oxidoreductase subunit E, partial [Thermoguttaceae bacterium]
MAELDLTFVDQAVARYGTRSDAVIPILQAIQAQYRYLPPEALKLVCDLTEITPAAITGVATFYTQFRHRPVGRHIIKVCHGTACHVKGSGLVQDALERRLKIDKGDDTDREGLFTIEKIACLGCCTLAPVVQIDGITYGHVAPVSVAEVLADFLQQKQSAGARQTALPELPAGQCGEIRIGLGSCCTAQGSGKVFQAVEQVLAESGAPAVLKRVGCV